MKPNVFQRDEPDGTVTVWTEKIEANGYDLEDACAKLVRKLREVYPFHRLTVVGAEE